MVATRYKQVIPPPRRPADTLTIVHPFANQDAVARQAVSTMSRIRRVSKNLRFDIGNQEVVREGLKELLKSGGPGVPAFVRETLHGRLGVSAARVAHEMFWRGIDVSGENTRTSITMPVAEVCLAHGTLDVLRELVLSGAPSVDVGFTWTATKSRWLDFLCTTSRDRSHLNWGGFTDEFDGLVGLVARHHQEWSGHCRVALELVLEVDKDHLAFARLVDEPSAAGAFVREFVMHKRLEASTAADDTPRASPTTARSRRASI